jgi:hypothetical protein
VEDWKVLYEDAVRRAKPDDETELQIHAWALLCTTGPPEDGFPLNENPGLPMEEEFWQAPVGGTTLIARYLIVTYERLIIVKDFS